MNTIPYGYWRDGFFYLKLYVVPRAKMDHMVGLYATRLKVQIAAPANDGKANQRLLRFLAQQLAVARSSITLMQGEGSRYKLVKIAMPQQLYLQIVAALEATLQRDFK